MQSGADSEFRFDSILEEEVKEMQAEEKQPAKPNVCERSGCGKSYPSMDSLLRHQKKSCKADSAIYDRQWQQKEASAARRKQQKREWNAAHKGVVQRAQKDYEEHSRPKDYFQHYEEHQRDSHQGECYGHIPHQPHWSLL